MSDSRIDAGALFRRHADFVERFLLGRGAGRDDVSDLVQDVFLVAHRKGGFRQAGAKPTSWLAAIAVRVAADRRRKCRRKRIHESIDGPAIAAARTHDSSPCEVAATKEELKRVRRVLRRMPGNKRAVFVMYEFEGRSCAEIAEIMRIPLGTVHSRLHSARAQFERKHRARATERPLALSDTLSFVSLGA